MSWARGASYLVVIIAAITAIIPNSIAIQCMNDNASYKEQQQGLFITSTIGIVLQIFFILGASYIYFTSDPKTALKYSTAYFIMILLIALFGLVPTSSGINCMNSNSSYADNQKGLYGTSIFTLILQIYFIIGTCLLFGISLTDHYIQFSEIPELSPAALIRKGT